MLYFGTVELRMTEDVFWATTPRKFSALKDAAMEYKELLRAGGVQKEEQKFGYIDQIPGW